MNNKEIRQWRNVPCVLEVDLEYPECLHDLLNDYPLAPEQLNIETVDKLIPNIMHKQKYVLHCENVKSYEDLGLKITQIHRGTRFEESKWLENLRISYFGLSKASLCDRLAFAG